jgi:hypothetical protein
MDKGDEEARFRVHHVGEFTFLGVLMLWIASPLALQYLLPKEEARGLFGDSFGAINALFSGLAFAGVIVAIMLQREELRLQRQELEQTREELRGQKEEQARMANAAAEQAQHLEQQAKHAAEAARLQLLALSIEPLRNFLNSSLDQRFASLQQASFDSMMATRSAHGWGPAALQLLQGIDAEFVQVGSLLDGGFLDERLARAACQRHVSRLLHFVRESRGEIAREIAGAEALAKRWGLSVPAAS